MKKLLPILVASLCVLHIAFTGCSGLSSSLSSPPDLVAYYPFDGNANDASGNGLHGSTRGGVTWVADRFDNPRHAAHFNGRDASIAIADSGEALNFDVSSQWFSVSCWVNLDALPRNRDMEIIIDRGTSDDTPASFDIFYRGSLESFVADTWDGKVNIIVPSQTRPAMHEWYHLVMVADRETIRLYVNGKRDLHSGAESAGTIPASYRSTYNGQKLRTIGDFAPEWVNGHHYFNGVIDDIRIYRRALTDEEILSLYHEQGW